jgi:hypothetical protein
MLLDAVTASKAPINDEIDLQPSRNSTTNASICTVGCDQSTSSPPTCSLPVRRFSRNCKFPMLTASCRRKQESQQYHQRRESEIACQIGMMKTRVDSLAKTFELLDTESDFAKQRLLLRWPLPTWAHALGVVVVRRDEPCHIINVYPEPYRL